MKLAYAVLLLVMFISVGCHRYQAPTTDESKLPTRVDGASDRVIKKMQNDLVREGARVITMGQNYLISIPSALLFADQSPKINWGAYALLNDVACYLQQFRKITVQVNAFSTPYVSCRREHALTLARANAVADYLWSQGIDSRFIFSKGVGIDKPIIAFAKRGDISQNSRIEITFRRAVG